MTAMLTGIERQNAAGTGAESYGILTDDRYWSSDELARCPDLEAVPFTITDTGMIAQTIGGTGLCALYEHGALLYAWPTSARGTTFRPISAEAERLAAMSPGELAHHYADRAQFSPTSVVYFVGHREHAIKIGTTVSLKNRYGALQANSPLKLEIFATRPGGQDREAAYHTQFAGHRLHNEWFAPHPDILAEIDRLSA
jgi:hypothetical protein